MKKYLIWNHDGTPSYPNLRMWDGDRKWCANCGATEWFGPLGACQTELAYAIKHGRFVTLDHEPTPAEVRTLLEGPEPLSECLDALKEMSPVLWSAYRHLNRLEGVIAENEAKCVLKAYKTLQTLLEKYREGGK